jgi:hypothetical protein
MKKKVFFIIITIIVIIIALGLWIYDVTIVPPPIAKQKTNSFVDKIRQDINLIKNAAQSVPETSKYNSIKSDILSFASNGDLGDGNQSDNQYWQDKLTEELTLIFSKNLVQQGNWIFSYSCDLSEVEALSNCINLVEPDLNKLQNDFSDSLRTLLESCKRIKKTIEFTKYCLEIKCTDLTYETEYPFETVQNDIKKLNDSNIEIGQDKYLKNCAELKNIIQETVSQMVGNHGIYIENKIEKFSNDKRNNIFPTPKSANDRAATIGRQISKILDYEIPDEYNIDIDNIYIELFNKNLNATRQK